MCKLTQFPARILSCFGQVFSVFYWHCSSYMVQNCDIWTAYYFIYGSLGTKVSFKSWGPWYRKIDYEYIRKCIYKKNLTFWHFGWWAIWNIFRPIDWSIRNILLFCRKTDWSIKFYKIILLHLDLSLSRKEKANILIGLLPLPCHRYLIFFYPTKRDWSNVSEIKKDCNAMQTS
jgi:hypothetical protein